MALAGPFLAGGAAFGRLDAFGLAFAAAAGRRDADLPGFGLGFAAADDDIFFFVIDLTLLVFTGLRRGFAMAGSPVDAGQERDQH